MSTQDAQAPSMDLLPLRFLGEGTPPIAAHARSMFGSPATVDSARFPYALEEVSRISAGGANASVVAFYSVFESDSDAHASAVGSIRVCLSLVTLSVPGRDNLSTSCSFGARFDSVSAFNDPTQNEN